MARDLWDLRVRGFGGLRGARDRGGGSKKGKGKETRSEPSSEGEMMMFSSQGESEAYSDVTATTNATRSSRGSRIKNWSVSEGQKWAMPNLMDTLALGYVACFVMRWPVGVGELLRAARGGGLLFVGAVSDALFGSRNGVWMMLTLVTDFRDSS